MRATETLHTFACNIMYVMMVLPAPRMIARLRRRWGGEGPSSGHPHTPSAPSDPLPVLHAATMVLASEKDVGVGEFIRLLQVTGSRQTAGLQYLLT